MEQMPRRQRRPISTDGFITTPTPSRNVPRQPRPSHPGLARQSHPGVDTRNAHRSIEPTVFDKSAHKTKPHKKHGGFRTAVKRVSLVFVALLIATGGFLGFKVYRNIAKVTKNNNPFSLLSAFQPVTLKGQETGRVNVLLAGNSTDDPGHQGAGLTDSIMIMSLDTRDNSAFLLSVPRDLWVSIPSMGYTKLNAAGTASNYQGEGYPNGGMGQLEEILEDKLGIDINYYALINYSAFRDAVNAVGGVNVDIESKDPRGLYDPNIAKVDGGPLKLTNGSQQLDGQTALNLARARGDHYKAYGFPGSDFDRTAHQRQLLLALKAKASSSSVLSDPLKIGKMADAIGDNVKTDMKINEIETFYSMTKDLKDSSITSYNVNNINNQQLLANYRSASGQSALVPAAGVDDYSDIQSAVKKLISTDPIVKEGASVVVLNGGEISGLAKRQASSLETKGLTVLSTADAPATYTRTMIVDNTAGKKPGTKAALEKLYGVTATVDKTLSAANPSANFIVVLGTNLTETAGSNNLSTH